MIIQYTQTNDVCLTPCPHKTQRIDNGNVLHVASVMCVDKCSYFVDYRPKEGLLECRGELRKPSFGGYVKT